MRHITTVFAISLGLAACMDTSDKAMVTKYEAEPTMEVLSAQAEPVAFTDTEYSLADLRGTADVRDVYLRNGRVEGVVTGEGEAVRFVAYGDMELTDTDGFGLSLGEGGGEPMGRSVDDLIGQSVEVSGMDAPVELTDIVFERDGGIAYYVVDDEGEEVRVEPFKVALPVDIPQDEPEYEDAPITADDYLPERK